jgi:hypothetical protein
MKGYRSATVAPWCELQERADGVQLRFGCGDEHAFGIRLEALKVGIPPHARRWHPDTKTWWVSAAYRYALEQWRLRWFEHSTPSPSPSPWTWAAPPPSGVHGAYAALHLLPTAPLVLVKAAYRTLAALHHPDKGGNAAAMVALNAAYAELEKVAA